MPSRGEVALHHSSRVYRKAGIANPGGFEPPVPLAWHNGFEILRHHGFSNTEILDVTMAASTRNFFSRIFNALVVEPELANLAGLEDDLATAW
jgi:hypothetical protein